eukprot:1535575-Rhodomonas_salina.1
MHTPIATPLYPPTPADHSPLSAYAHPPTKSVLGSSAYMHTAASGTLVPGRRAGVVSGGGGGTSAELQGLCVPGGGAGAGHGRPPRQEEPRPPTPPRRPAPGPLSSYPALPLLPYSPTRRVSYCLRAVLRDV